MREPMPLDIDQIVVLGDNFRPKRLHGRRARVRELTHNAARLHLLDAAEDERALIWFPRCYIARVEREA